MSPERRLNEGADNKVINSRQAFMWILLHQFDSNVFCDYVLHTSCWLS